METFREKGSAGFYAAPHRTAGAWPGRELWPLPPNVPAMTHAAGLVLVWMFVTLVLMSLASQDAGKVGWTLEWLFGLPVSARALMVAQAIQWTILNPVGWILTFGLVLAILGSAGYGVWAVPLAALVALCMNVMVASVRLVVETWLRQHLAHARLRNLQAVAAVLGILAADPLRHGNARKVGAGFVYLYLLLVGLYAYAIYAESVWPKMAQVALCVLVAIAIWRKVRDRMPFLLDPTEGPPPSIGLSDGLIAAFCFFSVQGLLQLALAFSDADTLGPGGRTAVAYAVAGGIVTTLAVLIFAIKKKAHPPPARRVTAARALLEGVGWGLGAAAFGLAYLWAARSIAPLRASIEDASRWLSSEGPGEFLLAGLLIVVAPVFEEYLFRGLVFRGMLRSLNPTAAVLASAAIFAMVHPRIWVVPVFVLGVAAALSYRRTGRLGAPILAHMIYSTAVVTSQMIV